MTGGGDSVPSLHSLITAGVLVAGGDGDGGGGDAGDAQAIKSAAAAAGAGGRIEGVREHRIEGMVGLDDRNRSRLGWESIREQEDGKTGRSDLACGRGVGGRT